MTALLVDLGNSRWKIAFADGGRLTNVRLGKYDDVPQRQHLFDLTNATPTRLLVAKVAGDARHRAIVERCESTFALTAEYVKAGAVMAGVRSGYREPAQLGVDRLLAMVAAHHRLAQPVCVIDAGTAVTIDFVAADGQHLGGLILPGLRLSRQCLLNNTAIPADEALMIEGRLGRDTPTAVALGTRLAVAGIVESLTRGSQALSAGEQWTIVLGGGDAGDLAPLLPSPCIRMDELVLQGLAVVADRGDVACAGS
jgi:type III pantothenate kinase